MQAFYVTYVQTMFISDWIACVPYRFLEMNSINIYAQTSTNSHTNTMQKMSKYVWSIS